MLKSRGVFMRIPKQVTFFTKKLLFIEKLNSKKIVRNSPGGKSPGGGSSH